MSNKTVKFKDIKLNQEFFYDGAKFKRTSLALSENKQSGLAWEMRGSKQFKEWSIGLTENVTIEINYKGKQK